MLRLEFCVRPDLHVLQMTLRQEQMKQTPLTPHPERTANLIVAYEVQATIRDELQNIQVGVRHLHSLPLSQLLESHFLTL